MTTTVHVGSKNCATVIVPIEARGIDQTEARRTAIQFARARYQISDPIALSEHEAAIRMRRQFVAKFAPKPPANLNGIGKPFWLQPDSRYRNN